MPGGARPEAHARKQRRKEGRKEGRERERGRERGRERERPRERPRETWLLHPLHGDVLAALSEDGVHNRVLGGNCGDMSERASSDISLNEAQQALWNLRTMFFFQ